MEKTAHYFYALKLPMEAKQSLYEHCSKLKRSYSFSRWVHQEDYHITLAFLGSAEKEQLQNSIRLVEQRTKGEATFPLTIEHLGVFGRSDSPRIFWAGIEKENRLSELRDSVYEACLNAEFKLETRPFHPHITLARKWSNSVPFDKDRLIQYDPFTNHPIGFLAKEVVLYQTHLDRVPKYEAVKTFSLKT